MTQFVSTEILSNLKHEVLQSIVNPDDTNQIHGVEHAEVESINLADAPVDVPLLLTSPLDLGDGNKLYGYVKKSSVPDIPGGYLQYKRDVLLGTEPKQIQKVHSLFGLSVPEGIVGAKELVDSFLQQEYHLDSKVILLDESSVNGRKVFAEMDLTEPALELKNESYDYVEPDFGAFLEGFNPHAAMIVPLREELGRPIETTNVRELADLDFEQIAYIKNSAKILTGLTTIDGAQSEDGVALITGSMLYRISHAEALALDFENISSMPEMEYYFFTPLAWYVPANDLESVPVEISFKIIGLTNIEGLYMVDFDLDYETHHLSGTSRPIEQLGITSIANKKESVPTVDEEPVNNKPTEEITQVGNDDVAKEAEAPTEAPTNINAADFMKGNQDIVAEMLAQQEAVRSNTDGTQAQGLH